MRYYIFTYIQKQKTKTGYWETTKDRYSATLEILDKLGISIVELKEVTRKQYFNDLYKIS